MSDPAINVSKDNCEILPTAVIENFQWKAEECGTLVIHVSDEITPFSLYLYKNSVLVAGWNPKISNNSPYQTQKTADGCASYTLEAENGDLAVSNLGPCKPPGECMNPEPIPPPGGIFSMEKAHHQSELTIAFNIHEDHYFRSNPVDFYVYTIKPNTQPKRDNNNQITSVVLTERRPRVGSGRKAPNATLPLLSRTSKDEYHEGEITLSINGDIAVVCAIHHGKKGELRAWWFFEK